MSTRADAEVKHLPVLYAVEKPVQELENPLTRAGFVHPLEPKVCGCQACGVPMISHRGETRCRFCRKAEVGV